MNLGYYVTDLISLANNLQKIAADGKRIEEIYQTALEIKSTASELQEWAKNKMKEKS
jgi:hypothetical protein